MKVQLNLMEKSWQRFNSIWIRGCVIHADKILSLQELECLLKKTVINDRIDVELLKATLRGIKGFFAIVWTLPAYTVLITDIVRTYPLFFLVSKDRFIIRDSLPTKIGLEEDVCSIIEFMLTGFVSGFNTTWKNVFQVQAGEVVVLHHNSSEISRVCYNFFNPLHPKVIKGVYEEEEFISKLDYTLSLVTERLVKYLNGRTAVVPLSGGWDSRTIILHLKRWGYPRVVAFSYGKEGNQESVIAAEVARQLGVEYVFMPYQVDDWRALSESSLYLDYLMYAHNSVSVPHIQDLLAIFQMVRRGIVVSGDAVVIPGHSADFVAGSHLRSDHGLIRNIEELVKAIFAKHYVLMPPQVAVSYILEFIKPNELEKLLYMVYKKIEKQIKSCYQEIGFVDPHALLDFWNWRERQAKFIVNSIRVYEYFDLDFWLPLWDVDFVKFWENMPLEWRINRMFYHKYIVWLQNQMAIDVPVSLSSKEKEFIKAFFRKIGLADLFEKMWIFFVLKKREIMKEYIKEYDVHPLQWYGVWNRDDFYVLASRVRSQININTLITIDVFQKLYR